jgi:hypothetical protein
LRKAIPNQAVVSLKNSSIDASNQIVRKLKEITLAEDRSKRKEKERAE